MVKLSTGYFSLVAAVSVLVIGGTLGCSRIGGTPKCSSETTKDTIFQMQKDKFKNIMEKLRIKNISDFGLTATRETSYDKETGKRSCAAELNYTLTAATSGFSPIVEDFANITAKGERTISIKKPIAYTVEKTEDGNAYITAYGL